MTLITKFRGRRSSFQFHIINDSIELRVGSNKIKIHLDDIDQVAKRLQSTKRRAKEEAEEGRQ